MAFVVIKQNEHGQETWRYPVEVLRRDERSVLIEARFNRDRVDVAGMVLTRGDRFVEIYYADRWYNIFEIYDQGSGALKGWYCNVSLPAEITPESVTYVDLALDLLVFPDGTQKVLDEDEFARLEISAQLQAGARQGLAELQKLFASPAGVRLVD